mmetsp:Transcript_69501/g.163340  ORF Transcript_69501/g.163340 Transcript_69501/m.163340 type:complete len:685 (+) Transcript_69501:15-2069(+)
MARASRSKKGKQNNNTLWAVLIGLVAVLAVVLLAPASSAGSTSVSVDAPAVRNLCRKAVALREMNKFKESVDTYKEALALSPKSGMANLGLGISLEQLGSTSTSVEDATANFKAAVEAYLTCIETGNPHEVPIAHNNIGNLYRERFNNISGAIHHTQIAIDLSRGKPNMKDFFYPYKNMGALMEKSGNTSGAIQYFAESIEKKRDDGLKVYSQLLLPYVYNDLDEMARWRQQYADNLQKLLNEDLHIENPARTEGVPGYYLGYHGQSNTQLAKDYAKLLRKSAPVLDYTAPHVPGHKKGKKIKVGFVSYYFREHSVSKMIAGLLKQLKGGRITIVLFNIARQEDSATALLREYSDKYVKLPVSDINTQRNLISMEQLDIVVYAELGMDPNSYALANMRLAPVQIAMHGHADTSGIPTVDYYVTYAGFDERKFDHYSERVLRVDGHTPLMMWYDIRPFNYDALLDDPIEKNALKAQYNIPTDVPVFACLQTLFKLTPHMDKAFLRILTDNPTAVLLVKELPMTDRVGQYLRARLEKKWPTDALKRLVFLPPLSDDAYRNIFATVDIVLDSFPFGGHTSSMDALSNNIPVVTLPTQLLSGRCTLGFLNMLDLPDLIAKDESHYVSIANKLAQNQQYFQEAKQKISSNFRTLTSDTTSVKGWERLLFALGCVVHNRYLCDTTRCALL